MNTTDWLVIVGGAAMIGWVNWYFFFAPRSAVTAFGTDSATDSAAVLPADGTAALASSTESNTATPATTAVTITVKGGYDPAAIRVRAGQPVRLVFDRQETSGCSEEVVFPDFNIKKFLPAFQKTTIELTPPRAGRYGFTCGMSMLHGSLIAE
ncbi:MAG: cupredoxin domain-containing protein [Gemmatimonadota bacterium]|nr:cupredoxin domain-containing protein [Gemmatimonadota bacterium]